MMQSITLRRILEYVTIVFTACIKSFKTFTHKKNLESLTIRKSRITASFAATTAVQLFLM